MSSSKGDDQSPSLKGRQSPSKGDASETTPLVGKPAEAKSWKSYFQGQNALVLFYSVALLVCAVGNSIFFKKMTNAFVNYPYFLTQITTFVYIPIFSAIVAYEMYFTNYITEDMYKFPKSKFFWMGAFDALAGVFGLFGAVHTSGSTQALLGNAVIPVTMLLSWLILSAKFRGTQIWGATIIMVGVTAVVALPSLLGSSGDGSQSSGEGDKLLFNMIYLVGVIPQALSSVYKEIAFVDADIDVNYLQAWVAVWQLVFGFLLVPLNTLSFLGPNAMPWSKLPYAMYDGTMCMLGYNTVVAPNCHAGPNPPSGAIMCDDCNMAWVPMTIYMLFNVAYNLFSVLVIKYGGAALMYIVMTLRLPLVQLAFAQPWINNPPEEIHWPSLLGLAVILIGLITYRWTAAQAAGEGGDNEDVVVFVGLNQVPIAVHRRPTQPLPRTAVQIRSSLYSRLGVINSPITPHSPRHRSPAVPRSTSKFSKKTSASARNEDSDA